MPPENARGDSSMRAASSSTRSIQRSALARSRRSGARPGPSAARRCWRPRCTSQPQSVAGVLLDEAPLGAREHASLRGRSARARRASAVGVAVVHARRGSARFGRRCSSAASILPEPDSPTIATTSPANRSRSASHDGVAAVARGGEAVREAAHAQQRVVRPRHRADPLSFRRPSSTRSAHQSVSEQTSSARGRHRPRSRRGSWSCRRRARSALAIGCDAERVILEVEAPHVGVRRNRVEALLAAGAEQLQRGHAVHLRVVEPRDRRRRHHVAAVDLHRVVVAGLDAAPLHDDPRRASRYQPVLGERMQLRASRRGAARAGTAARAAAPDRRGSARGERRSGMRWRVWIIVASRVRRVVAHAGRAREERRMLTALVVSSVPWSITFSMSSRADDRRGDLDAAGAPAVGQRHLARAERHLIAGHRDRLEQRAADHPLGLFVEVGEVVAVGGAVVCRVIAVRSLWRAAAARDRRASCLRPRAAYGHQFQLRLEVT